MTTGWHDFNPRQRHKAEDVFHALSMVDAIVEGIEEERPRRAGFTDLYAFATNPDREMSPTLSLAFAQDPSLEGDLLRILERTARYQFPKVAAASSGSVARRDGDQYRILLRPSRADPMQVYVVIELGDIMAAPPRTLYVCRPGCRCEKHRLPVAHDGTIQILADSGSSLVEGLQDNRAEVFLR